MHPFFWLYTPCTHTVNVKQIIYKTTICTCTISGNIFPHNIKKHSNMHPVFGLYTPCTHAINLKEIMYKTMICMYAVYTLQAHCTINVRMLIWLPPTVCLTCIKNICTISARCPRAVNTLYSYVFLISTLCFSFLCLFKSDKVYQFFPPQIVHCIGSPPLGFALHFL